MMRTEKEMYDLILGIANADDRIRGVYMAGPEQIQMQCGICFRIMMWFT